MKTSEFARLRTLARVLIIAVILAVIFLVYLGALVASIAALLYFSRQILADGPGLLTISGLLLATGAAVFLSTVLLRGFLLRETVDRSEFIELLPQDEPELFAFLEDLCRRTGAPMPHRVFAAPNVNAGVFFDTSALNLFWPVRKNLLIGLGMVNTLNRTEFEAVLAHELGHFSQPSMRLSHFVQVWSAVLEQIVDARQTVDPILRRLSALPLGAFGIAPLAQAVDAAIRRVGQQIINYLHRLEASISWQMELAADRVAVALTGSDALIHALLRTDWAERCFNQTIYDLEHASQAGLRSDDLYFHQQHLIQAMRERLKEPTLGLPPELPEDPAQFHWVFADTDSTTPPAELWETHPPHHIRERRARENYRRTRFDERSAWTLFSAPEKLRARQTELLYEQRWQDTNKPSPAPEVQRYITGEHRELILNPLEQLVFGHRFLEPGDFTQALELAAANSEQSDDDLRDWLRHLTGPRIDEAAQRLTRHITTLPPASSQRGASYAFRKPQDGTGDESPQADTSARTQSAQADRLWLARFDRDLLIATLRAARRLSDDAHEELVLRYSFHLHLQDLIRWMRIHSAQLPPLLQAFHSPERSEAVQEQILAVLQALHSGLKSGLDDAPPTPPLHGLPQRATLSTLALDTPLIDASPLAQGDLDEAWLTGFLEQWQLATNRLDHLRRKSLGALLLYQKQIIAPWLSTGL